MDYQFILLEQHKKKSVEYISNCCNKVNFRQKIFMFQLITDLFVSFIMQYGRLFCRGINEKVLLKTIKLFNNLHQAWFNVLQKFMRRQAKFSLNFFIAFTSGSRESKPYIQSNTSIQRGPHQTLEDPSGKYYYIRKGCMQIYLPNLSL